MKLLVTEEELRLRAVAQAAADLCEQGSITGATFLCRKRLLQALEKALAKAGYWVDAEMRNGARG